MGESRARLTLSDQLSVQDSSSNLRDLLKVRHEDDHHHRREPCSSLAAVLASSEPPGPSRTLFDIIREEPPSADAPGWQGFKDQLLLRRTGSASGGSAPSETLGSHRSADPEAEPQPVRMSLMALLAEADRMGEDGESPAAGRGPGAEEEEGDEEEEEEEEEEEDPAGGGGRGMELQCCVCMVRHKGSAFIPCGHTFCRLCSRELWVSRGNCPLCNGYILEILDIF